jgi:aryl-alcohol dehydrogenase-like predicted oxidoreductase
VREQVASDEQFDVVEAVAQFASDRDVSMTDVAIGALLARPTVSTVIAGATKPEQVRVNVAAARWTPSENDLAELESVLNR